MMFVHSIFQFLTDTVPSTDQSMNIYHLFLQILPFIRYSNDNIDKNTRFFSALFKFDFNALNEQFEAKREAAKRAKQKEERKVLKTGYGNNSEIESEAKSNDSDSDDEADDDVDGDDEDQEMKDSTQNGEDGIHCPAVIGPLRV